MKNPCAACLLAAMCAACSTPPPARSPDAPPAARPSTAELPPLAPGALAARIDPIFATYASGRVPGCAVGIYRAGEVLFARGYGYADVEHGVTITPTTNFSVASVSKQFTAAAVLLLAGEGKLSLDDDVRRFVPELPVYGAPLTLRHLLHHTGGVRDYELILTLEGRDHDALTNADMLALLARQRSLNFPPGSAFEYSNSGYVLLSLVVERVSGEAFSSFVERRLFGPLGMSGSRVQPGHEGNVPGLALGYVHRPDGTLGISMSNRQYTGPAGVMTSVRDLARWEGNFYAPSVGGQALVDGLRTAGTLEGGAPIAYAMGLFTGESLGLRYEWHAGGAWGYRAVLGRYPEQRLAIGVLCNDASAAPSMLAEQVARAVLRADAPAPATALPLARARPPDPAFEPASLDDYPGRYGSDELTKDVEIAVVDGHLVFRPWGREESSDPLVPASPDGFVQGDLCVHFERDARARVQAVVFDTPRTRRVRLPRR